MRNDLKRYIILTFLVIINLVVLGQDKVVIDKDIFYRDTVGEFIQYGNIEPTDIVETKDSCFIITSQKYINFKDYWKRYNEFDYAFFKKIHNKEKYWSSIIKTNKNFHPLWEIKFEDRYVKTITKNKNGNFYISGRLITENKIWIGEINTEGKILWTKEYKLGSNKIAALTEVEKAILNHKGEILIIGEKGHLKFIRNYGKTHPFFKRIQFFKGDYKSDYFIACFDSIGNKKWIKSYKYANSIYLNIDFCSYQNNEIFASVAKTGYDNNFSSKLSLFTDKGKLIWENEIEKSVLYVNSYKNELLTCGVIDSTICLQIINKSGQIVGTKKIFKYVPNKQFKVIWIKHTINPDLAEGIIWLQNNRIYQFQFDNVKLTWHEIKVTPKYISFNKAIRTFQNEFVFTGYGLFDLSEKPLDLVKYMEIIEIQ